MIKIKSRGDFSNTKKYLTNLKNISIKSILESYARKGLSALEDSTPIDTGTTANSWYYKIEEKKDKSKIIYCNSNVPDGVPIAIILQYGHATRTGGWVEGRDYINPAIQPIFDEIANSAWREVTKL